MMWLLIIIILVVLVGAGGWGWPLIAAAIGLGNPTDKAGALERIVQLMHTHDIAPAEIELAFATRSTPRSDLAPRSSGELAKTLFSYLGAIFILAGIATYIGMFWQSMGSVMRVFVTLGVGYFLLVVLVSALHEEKFPKLILPLTLATVFMLTSGWFVLIHEVFPHGDDWRAATLAVFGVMAVHQAALLKKFNLSVLAFTALAFAYGFLDVGLDLLDMPFNSIAIVLGASLFLVASELDKTVHRVLAEPALLIATIWLNVGIFDRIAITVAPNWAGLLVGVCVMSAAYGLQKANRFTRLTALGYFVGSIMVYCGLFDLVYRTSFELLYLAVAVSMLYACVALKSRALLFTTVFAMLGFIGYFTAQHFAHSLGWPISLVLMGVAFFAVSTIAMKIRRRM